jgi:general secretion pathway protein H
MRRISATGSERGFTLLELMVVMAILVMIAAAFPLALDHAMPGRRVSTTAERLVARIHEAQDLSLMSGRPYRLTLQDHGLLTQDTTTLATMGHALLFPPSTQVSLFNTERQAVPALLVYPDGSAQAGQFSVADGAYRSSVLVSSVTGRVSVASGN